MLSASTNGCEKRRMVLSSIQGLVSRVCLTALGNGLDVLHLTDCCFHDHLKLMELCQVLTNEQAKGESRLTKARRL